MTDGQTMSKTRTSKHEAAARRTRQPSARPEFPGQVVLVLQGGGALGAYQVGVYEAMHEHGAEPDWVIGTSIGAINAALIAGNAPANRFARLKEFWSRVEAEASTPDFLQFFTGLANASRPRVPPSRHWRRDSRQLSSRRHPRIRRGSHRSGRPPG